MLLGPLRVILNTDVYVFYLGNNHFKLCSCIMIYICPDHIYIVFSFKTMFKLSIIRKSCAGLYMVYPTTTKGTVKSFPELLKERNLLPSGKQPHLLKTDFV